MAGKVRVRGPGGKDDGDEGKDMRAARRATWWVRAWVRVKVM